MRVFRTQVTLLLLAALIGISVLSMLATVAVYNSSAGVVPRVTYHMKEGTGKPTGVAYVTVVEQELEPNPAIVISFALLIAAFSATVSIIVGNQIINPLGTLQKAIESVNPDAIIPEIAEKGDGAALITVRLLNTLSARLKTAMDARMRLVAAAGHDLRTPLTRMRLRAEMLDDEADRDKFIADVDEMMHIANSAISLVKEESDRSRHVMVRLDSLVEDIVAELDMIGHHVDIVRLDPVQVPCRPEAMKRALQNLLVNACTHGKAASVSVRHNGGVAVCDIVDEGPGIPDDMIGRAFEPFFRADPARNKTVDGAGLGLAIVKEIITRHGGTITLSNRKPSGLHQEVVVPAV